MAKSGFTVVFAPETIEHLDSIERKHHGVIRKAIDEQLTCTPTKETRNRKPLLQPAPFDAAWELRCGPQNCYRVFYEVDENLRVVSILAIGVKEGSRLLFSGEEYVS